MELNSEFSLKHSYDWDEPIAAPIQQAIATYGNDDDRLQLAEHASVSVGTLESLSLVSSPHVRLAVARNTSTPPEALVRLTHDSDRFIRAVAKQSISELPDNLLAVAKAIPDSPLARLRARRSA